MALPLLIAHRGDSAHAPENTPRAFEQAVVRGADWIELDLQLSTDGEVFVFHDEELDRLTERHGCAADLRLEELRTLAIRPREIPPSPETRIPTLRSVLEGPGSRVPLYLELKTVRPDRADRLLGRVLEMVPPGSPHALASFDVDLVRGALLSGRRAVLIASDPRRLGELPDPEQAGLFAFSVLHTAVSDELAAGLAERGIPLWVWTVDHPADLARAWELGATGFCTNDVAATRSWIDDRGRDEAKR